MASLPDPERKSSETFSRSSYSPLHTPPRILKIISDSAALYDVPPSLVRSKCSMSKVVLARRVAAEQLNALGFSSVEIGRYLGGLHHSTILYLLGRTKQGRIQRKKIGELKTPAWLRGPVPYPDLSGEWAI